MAMAGAERIFEVIDGEEEQDGGYVTLVNAADNGSGSLEECEKRTGNMGVEAPPCGRHGHIHKA